MFGMGDRTPENFGVQTDVVCPFRAIFHDEHVYPEPFKFNPDRFENQEKNKLDGINELPHAAFGFSRR